MKAPGADRLAIAITDSAITHSPIQIQLVLKPACHESVAPASRHLLGSSFLLLVAITAASATRVDLVPAIPLAVEAVVAALAGDTQLQAAQLGPTGKRRRSAGGIQGRGRPHPGIVQGVQQQGG